MCQKKVLIFATCPLANDGITKIEMDFIRSMTDEFTFEFACSYGYENKYGMELKKRLVPFFNLPHKKNVLAYMFAIIKLVKKRKYDSVYIHGNSAMMFLEAIPAKLAGAKVITHCHNTKSDYPYAHYVIKPFFNLFVDKKIGCSILASKWAYCGKNIITIPNGIDVDKFKYNEIVRHNIRQKLGWASKKIVGHIGRFNKQKNHKKLLDIFQKMYIKDRDVRLLLIGDGELRNKILQDIKLKKLEEVCSIISYTEVPQDFMQAMDIVIMPSLFEGLCLVAIEAQANGLPIMIDQFFSPETSVTTQAHSLSLSLSDDKWADYGLELLKIGRKDVTKEIIEKNLTHSDMLNSIKNVIKNT